MRKVCMVLMVVMAIMGLGLSSFAIDPKGTGDLYWIQISDDMDLTQVRLSLEDQGGKILTLAPEDRILVRLPEDKCSALSSLYNIQACHSFIQESLESISTSKDEGKGLGCRGLTDEERMIVDQRVKPMKPIAPNQLSIQRTLLEGKGLQQASQVDNSLSIHFPPIRTQSTQNSCAAWATCYYFSTYTQALDENLDVSSGDNRYICSPSFLYPLENEGTDTGSSPYFLMLRLNDSGCASWNLMPYDPADYTTWPTQAAWVDALKRRTYSTYRISDEVTGCSETDLEQIKLYLANGGIAVTSTDIYDNMYDDYPNDTTGIDNGVIFANSGDYVNGHAMTLVGYDDNKSYYDGTQTRYGAFLVANSWGSSWGTYNSASTSKGFMWVGYEYFKADNDCFGYALINIDLDDYRPYLYVASGLNHAQRGRVWYEAGVGDPSSPDWTSGVPLQYSGGNSLSIDDSKRVVIDLTDGLTYVTDYNNIALYAELYISSYASTNGTMTSAYFYEDFDMNGVFRSVPSPDPTLTASPGTSVYATLNLQPADPPTSVGEDWDIYR